MIRRPAPTPADDAALPLLQARLGARVAAALSERSTALPHDVTERLRASREQALAAARPAIAAASAASAAAVVGPGLLALGGGPSWWQRALGVLPLALLLTGLVAIQQWEARQQVLTAADIDSLLLSDTLPPAAYRDPGFAEFLRADPENP